MNISQIEKVFSELALIEQQSGRVASRKFNSGKHAYLLSSENRVPIFSIECSESQAIRALKLSFNSLNILTRKFTIEKEKEREYFVLSLKKNEDFPIFVRVIESIVFDFQRKDGASIEVCLTNLKRWKSFWDSKQTYSLNDQEVVGLFGELHFLLGFHASTNKIIVENWTGPLGAEHDFILSSVAFEVKSSRNSSGLVSISNLRQLESMDGKELVLVTYEFREGGEGAISLKDLVYSIEDLCDEEGAELFWRRLTRLGYKLDDESYYDSCRFSCTRRTAYKIVQGFPRIINSSFKEVLDSRIRSISYTLELKDLGPFEVKKFDNYLLNISV